MNPDEIEDVPGEAPIATLLWRGKKYFPYIQSVGTLLFESYMALFHSHASFIPFMSFPMILYSSYSNGTTGQATLDYFITFSQTVDSVSPFTVSNSSATSATSHRTNAVLSWQNSINSENTQKYLSSPTTFLEKTIFSSLVSRNYLPSSNSSSLNLYFATLPEYSLIVSSFANQRSTSSHTGHYHPQFQTPN